MDIIREILKGFPLLPEVLSDNFAYAMIGYTESKLHIKQNSANYFDLMLSGKVIAYDRLKQKIAVVVNMKTEHVIENYRKACESKTAWKGG